MLGAGLLAGRAAPEVTAPKSAEHAKDTALLCPHSQVSLTVASPLSGNVVIFCYAIWKGRRQDNVFHTCTFATACKTNAKCCCCCCSLFLDSAFFYNH